MANKGKYYITTAIAYTSRKPHIGNSYEIVMTDALLGEITEAMATAVSRSEAFKVLLPVNRCGHYIVGVGDKSMSALVKEAVEIIKEALKN